MTMALIKKSLNKAQHQMVECFHEDSEVYEVVLHSPFINTVYEETVWIFGKHHLDYDYTPKQMVADLKYWMEDVTEANEGSA